MAIFSGKLLDSCKVMATSPSTNLIFYENYPNQWYLILNSDICIRSFKSIDNLEKLESYAIYLCNDRRNFKKLSDFRQGVIFEQFLGDLRASFFQLY